MPPASEEQKRVKDYIVPAIAYLCSRLALISLNQSEFTDGFHLINWSFDTPVRWHPLYPLLLKPLLWFADPIISGRILSIFCGLGAMLMLAGITRQLHSTRASIFVCWLYICSPLVYGLNLRVLTESLFQFLVFASIFLLLRFLQKEDRMAGLWCVFTSGLAMLTRPEGILFLPILVLLSFRWIQKKEFQTVLATVPAFVPWFLYAAWTPAQAQSGNYSDVLQQNLMGFQWGNAVEFLVSYVDLYPYILFYPVFFLALRHYFRGDGSKQWKYLILYFHAGYALILFLHSSWSPRFLLIPLSFLLVEASAELSALRKPTAVFLLIAALAFSLCGIFLQRKLFLDFRQTASAVRTHLPTNRVFSDEEVKTAFYLARDVIPYNRSEKLRPDDVLILHSFQTDLAEEKRYLDGHYRYRPLKSVEYSLIPLLADTVASRLAFTNSPALSIQRFERQKFQSVVLIIEGEIIRDVYGKSTS